MRLFKEKTVSLNFIPSIAEPVDELTPFRRDMLKFARLQLRDDHLAEDAVQETLVTALSKMSQFKNQSQLKTWVFAILKNKIIDLIRIRARSGHIAIDVDEIPEDAFDDLFDEKGSWLEDTQPNNWSCPEKSFTRNQFWEVFEACLTRLPENTARIFMMREMLGLETKEICKELKITSANCWVMLHRARMVLRLCLNERWFNSENHDAKL